MLKKIATVLLLVLTLAGCGSLGDEQIGVTTGALNYTATVAPPGNPNWNNQGWLWKTGWNPMTANWPAHNYARWSPYSGNGFAGWRTAFCTTNPPSPGTINVYSAANFAGQCSVLFGDPVDPITHQGGFIFNSDWIQASGLYATWTDAKGTNNVRIKSFKMAANTHIVVCDGPMQLASTCTSSDAYGQFDVPTIGPGTIWPLTEIAAIQLGSF